MKQPCITLFSLSAIIGAEVYDSEVYDDSLSAGVYCEWHTAPIRQRLRQCKKTGSVILLWRRKEKEKNLFPVQKILNEGWLEIFDDGKKNEALRPLHFSSHISSCTSRLLHSECLSLTDWPGP